MIRSPAMTKTVTQRPARRQPMRPIAPPLTRAMRSAPVMPQAMMLIAIACFVLLLPDPALAQLFNPGLRFDPSGRPYHVRQPTLWEAMVLAQDRLYLIAGATLSGFLLGWLFTPQARIIRWLLLLSIAFYGGLLVIYDHGLTGWSLAVLLALLGFMTGFGYWVGRFVRSLGEVPTTFGSARWATRQDAEDQNLLSGQGLRLGALDGTVLTYAGDRHLLTTAFSRSGKGTTQVIPNLLSYDGACLVLDPKGENALITAEARRAMGQQVHLVDPWGMATDQPARFNPLDWLVPGDPDITENAMLLADALVLPEGSSERFWCEEAKALLQGLILYVATDDREAGQRHLGRVRDLLLLDGAELPMLFERMVGSAQHIVASTGARCLQKDEKLLSNVLASAQAQTHFLDSARIRESLSASDFRFEDLKATPMSVYIVLPADRMDTFGRWLRLLIQQAITVNARNIETRPQRPVLFLLDEMATLGRLSAIEQAYGLMAGFGMQLWGVVQNFSQLKTLYGDGWETFVGNSGVLQYFGGADKFTAEYFSQLCGSTTVWNFSSAVSRVFGSSTGPGGGSSSSSTSHTDTTAASQRQLAYPDELRRMDPTKQLLVIGTMQPLLATRTPWFQDPTLKAKGRNLHRGESQ